jgi:hypothetical protein
VKVWRDSFVEKLRACYEPRLPLPDPRGEVDRMRPAMSGLQVERNGGRAVADAGVVRGPAA